MNSLEKYGIVGPNKGIFIIVLCSKWCRSCKLLSTLLNKFKEEGFINIQEIDIGENSSLAVEFNIYVVPALIFFKDGMLLTKKIEIYGELVVDNGVLKGTFNEEILREIFKQV